MRTGKGPGIAALITLMLFAGGAVGGCGESAGVPGDNVASAAPSAPSPEATLGSPEATMAPPASVPGTVAPPASAPAAPAPASAPAASCSPLSNEGTCYEPGEFCRKSDHGVTGVAGDGETITCADNNGWRWEPA